MAFTIAAGLGIFFAGNIFAADLLAVDAPISRLKQSHPRLILSEENLSKAKVCADSQYARALLALTRKAEAMLAESPASYRGDTMLEVSRTVLKRVTTLAYLYKSSGERKYFERARTEMLAAADFADWHPAHFLDTAEMMDALALGYDWLYDELSPDERKKIATAIWQKGLCEAALAYEKESEFWTRENHTNWNTVCNGSALTAALALSGDCDQVNFVDPAPNDAHGHRTPGSIAAQALARFKNGLVHYEPDGAFDEGPTYWHYSTAYAARAISALVTACGVEAGCCDGPGFAKTGEFARSMVGASGLLFNYADSGEKLHSAPELFWLAGRFGKPSLAAFERSLLASDWSNVSAFDLLWWQKGGELPSAKSHRYGGNSPLVVMHGDAVSEPGFFAGLLGGDNHAHHSHLGLGNFVIDFNGKRFVKLLGPDNYDMPGYFERSKGNDSEGWKYYRNNSKGQNVITFKGLDQDAGARATLTDCSLGSALEYAVFDLNGADSRAGVAAISRGLAHFTEGDAVLVQDQYRLSSRSLASSFDWHFHTDANVAPVDESHHALKLSKAGKSIIVRIISPAEGKFTLQEVDLPPPQYGTKQVKKIGIEQSTTRDGTVAVIFLPLKNDAEDLKYQSIKLIPLSLWPTQLHQLQNQKILEQN